MLPMIFFILLLTIPVSAETIILKSGTTLEGKIVEQADDHLKVDIHGVAISYYMDEIETIDGQQIILSKAEEIKKVPIDSADKDKAKPADPVVEEENTEDKGQIIDEVMLLSGMKTWLGQVPSRMDQILDGLAGNSTAEKADMEMIREIKNKVYGSGSMNEYFYQSLKNYYDAERFGRFADFLNTSLGKKITERGKTQVQMSDEGLKKEYEAFANEKPSEERLELVGGVIQVENLLRLELAGTGYSRVPTLIAMEPSVDTETLREDIAILVDEFSRSSRGIMDLLFPYQGFLCRNFSDQELREYIQHMLDPDIEYVREAIYQSVVETFAKMRNNFLLRVNLAADTNTEPGTNTKYGALSPEETLDQKRKQIQILTDQAMEHQLRGNLEGMQQSFQMAIGLMEQLLFLDPDDAGLCVSLGITYQMAHVRLGRAVVLLEKAVQLGTRIEQAHFTLGLIYLEWGELDRAEELFKQTLELNPEALGPDYNLGNVYRQKGQPDRAVEHLERAIKLDPEDEGAYGMLGLITAQQGKTDIAEKYLKEARRLGLDSDRIEQVADAIRKNKNAD